MALHPPRSQQFTPSMNTDPNQIIDLSPTQKVIWYGQQFHSKWPIYNTAYAFRFLDTIDTDAFSRAHERLIQSTDSFKMTFSLVEGKPTLQCFETPRDKLQQRNCSALSENEFQKFLIEETSQKLNLAECPWRSTLFQGPDNQIVWHLLQHHLLTDGVGFQIIVRRLAKLYRDEVAPMPSESQTATPSLAGWLKENTSSQTSKAEAEVDSANVQHSRLYSSAAPTGNPAGERRLSEIKPDLQAKINTLITQERFQSFTPELSLNFVLLSSIVALLSRIERRSKISIGVSNHGRNTREEKEIAGLLISIWPLRVTIEESDSFADLYEKVRELYFQQSRDSVSTLPHSYFTQDYDVTFNFLNGDISDFSGIPIEAKWLYPNCHESANRWRIHYFNTNQPNGTIALDFNNEAFTQNGKDIATRNLLDSITAFANNPDQAISEYILAEPSNSDSSILIGRLSTVPQNTNLWRLFRSVSAESPSTIAVDSNGSRLTYNELLELAEAHAQTLQAAAIKPNSLVPVVGQRSSEIIQASLAALRAGCAFLPIDSRSPKERIETIVADSKANVILDTSEFATCPPQKKYASSEFHHGENAYVIYTSGTTGVPNGVAVGHRSVLNLLQDMEERAPLEKGSRCMWWTAVNFDLSIYEVFSALLYGHTLHIPSDDIHMNAEKLFEWIQNNNINSAYLPPFMLNALNTWLDQREDFPLKRLLVGVEPIQENLLVSIANKVSGIAIINGYGPTEATVCTTFYSIDRNFSEERCTPIGKPLMGNRCYVLDQNLNLMPKGTIGELHIAGTGLAQGYWQRPELNKKRYIRDPFNDEEPDALMYKSGDLVRVSDEGQLEFVGRIDSQIKWRGLRIEPAEIEQTVAQYAQIHRCIALVIQIDNQDELVCCYTSTAPIDDAELHTFASKSLPFQLLPRHYRHFTSFPTTTNGKVDINELTTIAAKAKTSGKTFSRQLVAPVGPVEEHTLRVWSERLNTKNISTTDSFFQLGGGSLDAMEVTLQICKDFEIDIPLHTIFSHTSITELSTVIERKIEEEIEALSEDETDSMLKSDHSS